MQTLRTRPNNSSKPKPLRGSAQFWRWALIWPFDKQSTLLRALTNLAFYNDKGIDYSRHTSEQVESERAAGLARIRELVATVGPESLPSEFLQAVESGDVALDFTGRYIDLVKVHWASRGAP